MQEFKKGLLKLKIVLAKKIKKYKVLIILIIVFALPPMNSICLFLENILLNYPHRFVSNGNGTFTFFEIPFKDRKIKKGVKYAGSDYKTDFPNSADTIFYRTFRKYWIMPWHWQEYLFDASYQLPYKSIQEIRRNRPADIKPYSKYTSDGGISYVYKDE